jgi:hypothetical protein
MNTDTIQITPGLLALLSEIDEFKGAWRALGTLAPQRLNALRRVATIESIGSSTRIEGSKLTDREVEHLLARVEIKSFAGRDEQEVAGYAGAMETIFHAWSDIPMTENHSPARTQRSADPRPSRWRCPHLRGRGLPGHSGLPGLQRFHPEEDGRTEDTLEFRDG